PPTGSPIRGMLRVPPNDRNAPAYPQRAAGAPPRSGGPACGGTDIGSRPHSELVPPGATPGAVPPAPGHPPPPARVDYDRGPGADPAYRGSLSRLTDSDGGQRRQGV